MNNFLVTIAIPAYKSGYLRETILSAINQTYSNIEIVIVNDKSPHDITSIVHSFKDKRIRYYINDENIGGKDLVAQWNKCLSYAQGDFFCLLCDDDLYDPFFVETLITLSGKYPNVDVFRARARVIDKDGSLIDIYPSSPEYETVYDYMWQKFKGVRRQTISEFMIRTSHAKKVGWYISLPQGWGSDSLSIFQFGMDNGIASTPHILACFRQSGENISSNYKSDSMKKLSAAELYRTKCKELITHCKENDFLTLLKKYEQTDYSTRVLNILEYCPFLSYVNIIFRHHIGAKLTLKSFARKLSNSLRSITTVFRKH